MKSLFYLVVPLALICFQGIAQEAKELGSVDLSNNKDYYLSASEKGGKFIYKIFNQNDPATEVASFSLINNNFDNFKEMMDSATQADDNLKDIDSEDLEKYYFYFSTQNVFLTENETGKKTMEMVFQDAIPVYAYHHSNFAAITIKDIYYMLSELFPNETIDESYIKDPFSYDYTQLRSKDTIFNKSFQVRVESIYRIKNKNERLETLYKAINHQYYESIKVQIDNKLKAYEDSLGKSENELKNRILLLEKSKKILVDDTTSTRNQIINIEKEILSSGKLITSKKELLKKPIIKLEFEESIIPEEGTESTNQKKAELNAYISEIEAIYGQIKSHGEINFVNDSVSLFDSNDSTIQLQIEKIKPEVTKLMKIQTALLDIDIEQRKSLENRKLIESMEKTIYDKGEIVVAESIKIDSINQILNNIREEKSKRAKNLLDQLDKTNKFEFRPSTIQLDINRGFLENIVVNGSASTYNYKIIQEKDSTKVLPEHHLKFINDYPFGLSSKKDIEQLGNFKLYARFENGGHYEMKLGDLLDVITEKLEVDRKDYSPKNGSYEISMPTENKKDFFKADSREILEVKIFSDFAGIQENNPNGLIQIEFDKEIPLITRRFQKPQVLIPIRYVILRQANIGVLNFFKPQFIYSKIENNNKYLEVTSFASAPDSDPRIEYGVSTLDLKQYEAFSIGADLNLFLYDIPNTKSTVLINSGFRFGRTNLALDQETPEASGFPRNYTNTIQPSLEVSIRINGDERFGFDFSYGVNWLLSDELFFTQKAKATNFEDNETFSKSREGNVLQRGTILAYLNINNENNGRLFFRYRFNAELGDFKNNFAQLQVGYATYLTKNNK